MKHLLENWRQYIKEDVDIDVGDRGEDVILYHVSSTPDIEILDPAIAAAKVKNYTNRWACTKRRVAVKKEWMEFIFKMGNRFI